MRASGDKSMIEGVSVFALVIVAFAVVTALMGIRQVPQGYNYTVERFGKYHKTLTPGLGLIFPYIDSIGRKLNVMEQVVDVPRQEIITRDNATVTVDGVAFYQVLDVRRASYEIANLQQALLNLVMTNVRTVMGSMDLDQLLSHRDEINVRLLTVIDAASEPWGVKVTRIEIKDIEPPKDLVDAMARQMKAEREKRAVILEAEGMRQADITRAEGRKAAVVALMLVAIASTASFYLLRPDQLALIYGINLLGSVTGGPITALLWTMYADSADYAEWKRGRRATGLIFSASIFSQKQGWAIGAWAALALMQAVGFVANAAQTPASLHGLVLLMSVLPASLGVLSTAIVLFYPLNDARMSRITSDLKERRSLDAAG